MATPGYMVALAWIAGILTVGLMIWVVSWAYRLDRRRRAEDQRERDLLDEARKDGGPRPPG